MYFYNYHVDPDLIMDIYMMGYYKAEQLGDHVLAEETHRHECQINYVYLDQAFRQKYEEPEIQVTNFVDFHGIQIKTTDAGLDSLLKAIEADQDIQWNKENN
jgi:hypothetical protein